jgi:hypothetical protein
MKKRLYDLKKLFDPGEKSGKELDKKKARDEESLRRLIEEKSPPDKMEDLSSYLAQLKTLGIGVGAGRGCAYECLNYGGVISMQLGDMLKLAEELGTYEDFRSKVEENVCNTADRFAEYIEKGPEDYSDVLGAFLSGFNNALKIVGPSEQLTSKKEYILGKANEGLFNFEKRTKEKEEQIPEDIKMAIEEAIAGGSREHYRLQYELDKAEEALKKYRGT